MFWIIFGIIMVVGLMVNISMAGSNDASKSYKEAVSKNNSLGLKMWKLKEEKNELVSRIKSLNNGVVIFGKQSLLQDLQQRINAIDEELSKLALQQRDNLPKLDKAKEEVEVYTKKTNWILWPVWIIGGILLLVGLYFVWYYVCCGWLAFDMDDNILMRIFYFILSLLGLGFIIGLIAICFGWDPGD